MSNTSKVLVTGEQGQNNLLYLPLDKMIDSRSGAAPSSISGAGSVGAASGASNIQVSPRNDRSRESR